MATLKSLVNETTNIKNELITCHTDLSNNLKNKGVTVLNSDKLGDLINKVNNIEGSAYSVQIKIYNQSSTPTQANKGDIWIKSNTSYKIAIGDTRPSSPSRNHLFVKTKDLYCDITIHDSIDSYSSNVNKSYLINITTGDSTVSSVDSSMFIYLKNAISDIYTGFSIAQIYSSGWKIVDEGLISYWNGSEWVDLGMPKTLYLIQKGKVANKHILGNLEANSNSYTESTTNTTSSYLSARLYTSSGSGVFSARFTNEEFDLSNYTSVTITFSHRVDSGYSHSSASGYLTSGLDEIQIFKVSTTSTSYKTVTTNITPLGECYSLGLEFSSYNPGYIYIKDLYLSSPSTISNDETINEIINEIPITTEEPINDDAVEKIK